MEASERMLAKIFKVLFAHGRDIILRRRGFLVAFKHGTGVAHCLEATGK